MLAPRQKTIDGALLRHVPDQVADTVGFPDYVMTQHGCVTGGGAQNRDQDAECGALAGSVRTQEPEDLSGKDLKGEAVDGRHAVIDLAQPGGLDGDGPTHHLHHPQPFAPSRSQSLNWMRSLRRRARCRSVSASSRNCFSRGVKSR